MVGMVLGRECRLKRKKRNSRCGVRERVPTKEKKGEIVGGVQGRSSRLKRKKRKIVGGVQGRSSRLKRKKREIVGGVRGRSSRLKKKKREIVGVVFRREHRLEKKISLHLVYISLKMWYAKKSK